MKVSVIIPSYNHEKFIAHAIQSVLDQTYQNFEIIITDDGSSDNTVNEIKKFKDSRIKLFTLEENQGFYFAFKKCLEESCGDYLAMLSSDDVFLPNKLEKQVKFLEENKNYAAVFGFAQIIDEEGNDFKNKEHPYLTVFIQKNRSRFEWLKRFFYEGNCLCHPSVLIRKEFYTIDQFDPRYRQLPDFDFWIKLCLKADIHILQENLIKFRILDNEANTSGGSIDNSIRFSFEMEKILENYLNIDGLTYKKIFKDNIDDSEYVPYLICQKAYKTQNYVYVSFALNQLHKMLADKKSIETLANEYNFTTNTFFDMFKNSSYMQIIKIDEKDQQLQLKEQQLQEKNHQLQQKEQQLQERNHQFQQKEQLLQQKEQQIQQKEQQIHYLHEVAQSMRIKSRIKKVIKKAVPENVLTKVKYIKNNPEIIRKGFSSLRTLQFQEILHKIKTHNHRALENEYVDKLDDFDEVLNLLNKEVSVPSLNLDIPIDIIIPVYNGKDFLVKLLDSIVVNTTVSYRLIIVNDSSPDKTIFPFLKEFQKHNQNTEILLIDNEVNLGFVKTVNKAVEMTKSHFVILNTDTEVPYQWLERLMYPILQLKNVASTTPFTNAGTICSFPQWLKDNDIFENMDVTKLDEYFKYVNFEDNYAEMPTGVGFCMGVNKDLVNKIGFFDEEHFGRGYGEENDWCVKATQNNFRNILVPNLFVYHKHGVSFGDEIKSELQKENMKTLTSLHPSYLRDVSLFIEKNYSKVLRELLVIFASSGFEVDNRPKLIITHDLGGGSEQYTKSLFSSNPNRKLFTLKYNIHSKTYMLHFEYKEFSFDYSLHDFENVSKLILRFGIDEIVINQLVSYPSVLEHVQILLKIKSANPNIKIRFLFHDYYAICPSFNLLNHEVKYCNVPKDLQECARCLKYNLTVKDGSKLFSSFSSDISIETWRSEWLSLLEKSEIVCFSHSSKEILLKAYSELEDITIIPHSVDWVTEMKPIQRQESDTIHIAVIGHLTIHKGLNEVRKMLSYIKNHNLKIKITVIGEVIDEFKTLNFDTNVLGSYEKDNLSNLLIEHEVDIAFIPSICPETFSYTTEEIILMNFPLAVFNVGAPAKRVREYKNGIVIDKIDAKLGLATIMSFFGKDVKIEDNINPSIQVCCVVNDFLIYDTTVLSNSYMSQYELHMFDNTMENIGISKRYNQFIDNKMLDDKWVIFAHQDFAFLEEVSMKLDTLDKAFIYGPIGAVTENTKRVIYGEIHQGHNGLIVKHGKKISVPHLVETIDCACIIVHSSLIKKHALRFDEKLDFHHYAEEFCLNAKYTHNIKTKVIQLECVHTSYGTLSDNFFNAVKYVQNKYNDFSYVSTCPLEKKK